jgi:AraC-like DNA-binding protein
MSHQLISPPEILKPFVRYLWVLENDSNEMAPATFSALPDGCPGIMFQQSEKGAFCDNHNKKLPEIFLYGQTLEPAKMQSQGKLSTVGVCFHPDALKSLFGMDAHELTGACVDLLLLQNKKGRHLTEKLWEAATIEQQINVLSAFLVSSIHNNSAAHDAVTQYAVSEIWQMKGSVSLKDLQQKLRMTERSFERKFKQSVGISPKLFSRICRFQESLTQLRNNNYDKLSDIAYDNGYADQSHFIRSFKEFAGVSPIEYTKQLNEVTENFAEVKS